MVSKQMIAKSIEFNTRTISNRFMSTGEEFQLTVNINNTGVWTITGWSTPQSAKIVKQAEEIALRSIEIFYCSQPSSIFSPEVTRIYLEE